MTDVKWESERLQPADEVPTLGVPIPTVAHAWTDRQVALFCAVHFGTAQAYKGIPIAINDMTKYAETLEKWLQSADQT